MNKSINAFSRIENVAMEEYDPWYVYSSKDPEDYRVSWRIYLQFC